MKLNLASWGNALHNGDKSFPIVPQRRRWFVVSAVLMVLAVVLLLGKGLVPGMDFTGGTQFQFTAGDQPQVQPALDVVSSVEPSAAPQATVVNNTDIRLRMGSLETDQVRAIVAQLAELYDIPAEEISSSSIGPTWGAEVGKKAIQALIAFLVFVSLVMAIYFRNWRMAAAGLVALFHDLLFTVGIYALVGFEVTPAAVIGFLTILGYSLYDTVVVFDKVRENAEGVLVQHRYTYAEKANLAINQTMVRSINTSVVALLPVGSILFIGSLLMGAGTLVDIALALFVGLLVGTYSSIFIATPVLVVLQLRDDRFRVHTERVLHMRETGETEVHVNAKGEVKVGALQPGEHLGTRAQPKRKRRK